LGKRSEPLFQNRAGRYFPAGSVSVYEKVEKTGIFPFGEKKTAFGRDIFVKKRGKDQITPCITGVTYGRIAEIELHH
jgi:hypothetical protein